MNPFDYSKAFTDFWATQGQAWMKSQEQSGKAVAEGMQAMAAGGFPALPDMPSDLSTGVADLSRAGQSLAELWTAATSMFNTIGTATPPAEGDAAAEATLRNMTDPQTWLQSLGLNGPGLSSIGEMDGALGRMAEGPRLADLWEAERRYARIMQAWMDVRRRALEHNAVLLEAWMQVSRRFSEELAGRTSADGKALDAKATLALWTETANGQLLETQRSEPFLRTQTAMIRASTELSLAQQELVEHFGKQYGFPTRTELDDVHRTVTELRREMRAMRREQRMAAPPTPPTVPRMAPPRRPSAQRKGTH